VTIDVQRFREALARLDSRGEGLRRRQRQITEARHVLAHSLERPADITEDVWEEALHLEAEAELQRACTCCDDCGMPRTGTCLVHGVDDRIAAPLRAAKIEALEWVRLTKPNEQELDAAIENLKRGAP
jgi:hypothetical protein